jgi:2'-5' RNA ligase
MTPPRLRRASACRSLDDRRAAGWRERLGEPNAAAVPPHVTPCCRRPPAREALEEVEEHLRRRRSERSSDAPARVGQLPPVSPVVSSPGGGVADCERVRGQVRSGPLARELTFPYHPHVTVAHDLGEEALDRAFESLADYDARFDVWGFTLFEQDRAGVWRPQRDFPFGRGGLPGPVEPPAP